jgi:hypothetical protein
MGSKLERNRWTGAYLMLSLSHLLLGSNFLTAQAQAKFLAVVNDSKLFVNNLGVATQQLPRYNCLPKDSGSARDCVYCAMHNPHSLPRSCGSAAKISNTCAVQLVLIVCYSFLPEPSHATHSKKTC